MHKKKLLIVLFAMLGVFTAKAQSGYRIEVKVNQATADELYLAYHFGKQQYIADTAKAIGSGKYVFEGDKKLEGGLYLVALPPANKFFEILIDKERSQQFGIATDTASYGVDPKIAGSPMNKAFYEYVSYLSDKKAEGQSLQKLMQDPNTSDGDMGKYEEQLQSLSQQVKDYQNKVVEGYKGTILSSMLLANQSVKMPDPPAGAGKNYQLYYYRDHYFDNIDWSDESLLRTPILDTKITDYLDRLYPKVADSLIVGVDSVLSMAYAGGSEDMKKFVTSKLLNEYAKSKLMGMDAVYVHIAENYYGKGKTPWVEEEQLKKILDNAKRLSSILIGKKAPNLALPKLDGQKTTLHSVDAKYTVVYFWDPDCGNCSKASDKLVAMYDEYKAKGVEIFGICNKTYEELGKCVKKEEEKGMKWINTADPYGRGQAHAKYYVRANPLIFLLDKDKIIRYKRIDPDQLKDILDRELEANQEQN